MQTATLRSRREANTTSSIHTACLHGPCSKLEPYWEVVRETTNRIVRKLKIDWHLVPFSISSVDCLAQLTSHGDCAGGNVKMNLFQNSLSPFAFIKPLSDLHHCKSLPKLFLLIVIVKSCKQRDSLVLWIHVLSDQCNMPDWPFMFVTQCLSRLHSSYCLHAPLPSSICPCWLATFSYNLFTINLEAELNTAVQNYCKPVQSCLVFCCAVHNSHGVRSGIHYHNSYTNFRGGMSFLGTFFRSRVSTDTSKWEEEDQCFMITMMTCMHLGAGGTYILGGMCIRALLCSGRELTELSWLLLMCTTVSRFDL